MRLIRCLLYGFVDDISGNGTKWSDVLTGDQELEIRTATYGPGIDQSLHATSISHIQASRVSSFRLVRGALWDI